jgi:MoaA/NifB/PqqE/SkfB family radical SAM enzyme
MEEGGGFGFQWHITDRCPRKCIHCYQSDNAGVELPVAALIDIADGIMSAVGGPVTVNVTGGEPLIYQYNNGNNRAVFELLQHLSTFDNLGELNIITSTYSIDKDVIRGFKELPELDYIKVSLESDNSNINDKIRGVGHYKTALENIRELTNAGLRVIIMATLSRLNYQSVTGLCELAEKLGARGVIFERFVPLGRGAEMSDCVLTPSHWQEVLAAIAVITNVSVDDLRPYKAFWVDRGSVSGAPCCLGSSSMALMPDGTVYPCRRVPVPAGKLPEDSMEHILKVLEKYSSAPQRCFDFGA